jgi:hypothetical protein
MFKPELAHARYWKSKILTALDHDDEAEDMCCLSGKTYDMLTERMIPVSSGPSQEDFDDLVAFWSR